MSLHHGLLRYCVLALAVAFLLVPRPASAQFDAATVLGTVADASGGVVPGAGRLFHVSDVSVQPFKVTGAMLVVTLAARVSESFPKSRRRTVCPGWTVLISRSR